VGVILWRAYAAEEIPKSTTNFPSGPLQLANLEPTKTEWRGSRLATGLVADGVQSGGVSQASAPFQPCLQQADQLTWALVRIDC
jgi:hypothetical protein